MKIRKVKENQSGRVRLLTEQEFAPVGGCVLGAVYKQIGNAVPVRLAFHVGNALLKVQ
jgi:site-specific DNA-cytosine methylase